MKKIGKIQKLYKKIINIRGLGNLLNLAAEEKVPLLLYRIGERDSIEAFI